jgi:hypothetical protein
MIGRQPTDPGERARSIESISARGFLVFKEAIASSREKISENHSTKPGKSNRGSA